MAFKRIVSKIIRH